MVGTMINAGAIVAGGVLGVSVTRQLSAKHQGWLKLGLALLTIYAGLSMTWSGLGGSFWQIGKQFVIMMLSLILGNAIGKGLRIQKSLNRLGQYAKKKFSNADSEDAATGKFNEGFVTCTILFCVGPMAILGALQDGLTGSIKTLAIKAVMDGMATMAFSKTFGWGVILSALPVFAYQGTITLLAAFLAPVMEDQGLLGSVSVTGGLLIFMISLIILNVRPVPLADYLPSLAVAPLLTWLW